MKHTLPTTPKQWLDEIRLAIADANDTKPFGILTGHPITDADLFHLAPKRIKQLIEGVTAEMKGSKDLNLQDRLESVYEEAKRFVADLPSSRGDGEDG